MPPFSLNFATRTEGLNPSVIREILKLVSQPDMISFAGGMPAPELFPYAAIEQALQAALGTPAKSLAALQYGPSEGYGPLRALLAESLQAEGIRAEARQVITTTGSQQGIDMVARALVNPGDLVVVGEPTFLGALQSFSGFEARYATVPLDDEGMRTDVLAEVLAQHKPKLIYTIPSFQNPTGVSMSEPRKREVYALARAHGVPILEDDPYGELYFGPERPSTIKSLDDEGGVILARTFSKVLAPGLRVGYMVVPDALLPRLMPIKQAADLHTSSLDQALVYELLAADVMPAHLARLREVYRQRRDLMLQALAEHFPKNVRWTHPEGGLFVWVTLPDGLESTQVLEQAVAQKVAFIPGHAFYALGGGKNTCRLNFSCASESNIREGVKRLAGVLERAIAAQAV